MIKSRGFSYFTAAVISVFAVFLYLLSFSLFSFIAGNLVLGSIIASVILSSFFVVYNRSRFVSYNNDYTDSSFILFGLVLFGVIIFGEFGSVFLYNNFSHGDMDVYENVKKNYFVLYLIYSSFIAPIVEELFYRGFIYRFVKEKTNIVYGYVVSTLLFSFSHGTLTHLPITILLGFLCAVVYEYTGLLRTAIMFHLIFNFYVNTFFMSMSFPDFFSNAGFLVVSNISLFTVICLLAKLGFDNFKQTHIRKLERKTVCKNKFLVRFYIDKFLV